MMSVARTNTSTTVASQDSKIEPFAYQTSTIPEVNSTTKKEEEKTEKEENEDNKPTNINRRRSRATPEQLAILEATFEKNTSPNSKLREVLAEKVHMSERSIQIWFQNRRAKVKSTQKRNQQIALQDQLFRNQLYLQYPGGMYGYGQPIYQPGMQPRIINRSRSIDANMYSQSLNPVPEGTITNPALGRIGFAQAPAGVNLPINEFGQPVINQEPTLNPSPEKNYYNFSNKALVIGTWRRIFIPGDQDSLRCCFSIVDKKIRWIIKEQNIRFKVEFPFSSIGQIILEPFNNTVSTGKLSINLLKLPTFWMETNGPANSLWTMSGDFTENQQASKVFKHVIEGDYNQLRVEVASIVRSSIDLQQLCRIVTPTDLLYQQQTNHFQRRQSCPAGLLFNPNNQLMTGNRRLSIPSSTNLVSIPQNVVVQSVPLVQAPVLDTTTQMIQGAVNPIAKTTIGSNFVAPQPLNQPVVQKVQLATPAQATAVTAANAAGATLADASALQLQNTAQAAKPTIPTQTLTVGATPTVPINTVTENTIQPAAAAVPIQNAAATQIVNTSNAINPITLSSSATAASTATLGSNDLTAQTTGGLVMDNLNIMNGAQLNNASTDVLNFMNTENTENTVVDNNIQPSLDLGIDDFLNIM